jgi:hypothetical protein
MNVHGDPKPGTSLRVPGQSDGNRHFARGLEDSLPA